MIAIITCDIPCIRLESYMAIKFIIHCSFRDLMALNLFAFRNEEVEFWLTGLCPSAELVCFAAIQRIPDTITIAFLR